MELKITPYSPGDNEQALAVEELCPQGGELSLRFRRHRFETRSSVYERSVIFCAKAEGVVVGVAAGALKQVRLHGKKVRALYGYDLRVHPEYRRHGTARKLTQAVIEELSPAGCVYSYIAGENVRALQFTKRNFGARSMIDLQYLVIPVYRRKSGGEKAEVVPASSVREACLGGKRDYELIPDVANELMHGHVASLMVKPDAAGGSIWSNESLLAEEIARLPMSLRVLRCLSVPLFPLHLCPEIPGIGMQVRSLFVYNLFAHAATDLRELLSAVNNLALAADRTFIFILLQGGDPLVGLVREAGFRFLTVPYFFLAKGEDVPFPTERLFIDVRDL